jgi:flagellar FliJ protein
MKKFQFSLEKLQSYKEQILESEKNTLGVLRKELNDLQFQLEDTIRLVDMKSDELAYIMVRGVTMNDLASRKRFITFKQQEGHNIRRAIVLKEAEIEVQLQVVVDATKEVNTLEKLEERQLEEYRYAEMKEEEMFIEEFVSNQRVREQYAL